MNSSATSFATTLMFPQVNAHFNAAYALDLQVLVEVALSEDAKVAISTSPDNFSLSPLIKASFKKTLAHFKKKFGAEISVVGGGDNEATVIAVVLATVGALAYQKGAVNELLIEKDIREQFMQVGDVLVDKQMIVEIATKVLDSQMKGRWSYAKAYASLHGGFTLVDEKKRVVLRDGQMEEFHVLALSHPMKANAQKTQELIWNEALRGNLYTAMNLASQLEVGEKVQELLDAGATAASIDVDKNQVVGLFKTKEKMKRYLSTQPNKEKAITTKTSNTPATIAGKPKRIYRLTDFLKMKGKHPFHYL